MISEGSMVWKENAVQTGNKSICLDFIDTKKLEKNEKCDCKVTQRSNNSKTHKQLPNKNNVTFVFCDSFEDDLPLP